MAEKNMGKKDKYLRISKYKVCINMAVNENQEC